MTFQEAVVLGVGLIGTGLVTSLLDVNQPLRHRIKLFALATSRHWIEGSYEHSEEWLDKLKSSPENNHVLKTLMEYVQKKNEIIIVFDCTASVEPTKYYSQLLSHPHVRLVVANKSGLVQASELSLPLYQSILTKSHFGAESSVGAGLPIIQTVASMLASGDRIFKMEGVLSGTLSFLFNHLSDHPDCTLFDAVKEAHRLGFTEPDPRDDLSGLDVARKALILGRLCGLNMELENVSVQHLVPEQVRSVDLKTFWEEGELAMNTWYNDQISPKGCVCRYVAQVDVISQSLKCGLSAYERSHPLGSLQGSDNWIAIYSERFKERPLILQGAGAGVSSTVYGLLADAWRMTRQ